MDKSVLYQLLKKPSVVLLEIHKKANGAAKTNNLIIMYLKAKLTKRPNDDMESVLVKIPSNEKILNLFDVGEFKLEIIDSKDTSTLKMFFPKSQKNVLIWNVPSIKILHISKEAFIVIAARIALRKNWCGYSISVPLNLEVIIRIQ